MICLLWDSLLHFFHFFRNNFLFFLLFLYNCLLCIIILSSPVKYCFFKSFAVLSFSVFPTLLMYLLIRIFIFFFGFLSEFSFSAPFPQFLLLGCQLLLLLLSQLLQLLLNEQISADWVNISCSSWYDIGRYKKSQNVISFKFVSIIIWRIYYHTKIVLSYDNYIITRSSYNYIQIILSW